MGSGTEAAIFEEIYPKLRAFAAIVADLDMDPDDLVQDALVATLTRHKLEELDQPAAYLKRSILNRASNGRRSAGRFRKLLPKVARDSSVDDHYPSDLAILDGHRPFNFWVVSSLGTAVGATAVADVGKAADDHEERTDQGQP